MSWPAPMFAQIRRMANTVRSFERNLGSSVFPTERVAFSRSLWGLDACFRASGGARCVFEHAAFSSFRLFLHSFPLRDHFAVLSWINLPICVDAVCVVPMQHPLRGCFCICMPFSFAHFVRSLPLSVSLWSGIGPGLRSCSLKGEKTNQFTVGLVSVGKKVWPPVADSRFSAPGGALCHYLGQGPCPGLCVLRLRCGTSILRGLCVCPCTLCLCLAGLLGVCVHGPPCPGLVRAFSAPCVSCLAVFSTLSRLSTSCSQTAGVYRNTITDVSANMSIQDA